MQKNQVIAFFKYLRKNRIYGIIIVEREKE